MRVLVTGAAGYMGKHVVEKLLMRNHEVLAVDLNCVGIDPRAKVIPVNIFSGESDIYEKTGKPDLCIHLAWQDGFVHNSPRHMENLSLHFRFLKNMIDGGCKRIAVMGSMHEVGFWEGEITEDTPCNPLSLYGVAKNALRQSLMLLSQKSDVKLYWLRAYYILGDDIRNNSIFTKLLKAAEEGKEEFPFTTGIAKYDFLEVDELAEQIVAASTQDVITGIINVCSGKPVALKDEVEEFIQKKGLKIRLKYGAFPERAYDSKIVYGNNEKIQEILKLNGR